jgi:phosphopentomutase
VEALRAVGGELLITADHGNAEKLHDDATGQPHTAHTLCLVPCVYVGRPATIATGGSLQDIAPTLLAMMGYEPSGCGSIARHLGVIIVATTEHPGLTVQVSNHSLLL